MKNDTTNKNVTTVSEMFLLKMRVRVDIETVDGKKIEITIHAQVV